MGHPGASTVLVAEAVPHDARAAALDAAAARLAREYRVLRVRVGPAGADSTRGADDRWRRTSTR